LLKLAYSFRKAATVLFTAVGRDNCREVRDLVLELVAASLVYVRVLDAAQVLDKLAALAFLRAFFRVRKKANSKSKLIIVGLEISLEQQRFLL
jgi:hypothetical protein